MAKHTSWHAGGAADLFFTPRDIMDLASFVRQLPPEVPLLWLGLGSNLLVRDGGVRGAVVATHGALGALERHSATRIRAEAGVPCARIARQCVKWGLGPAEFFAGIPGTLGGALAMNAGAWGEETWRHVVEVEVLDRKGVRHTRTPADYEIGYRQVKGPENEWFIGARLEFERKPGINTRCHQGAARQAPRDAAHRRVELRFGVHQSAGRSRGAVDRGSGLKGFRIGDASVSEKHANFIINHGSARAADIEALILHVQKTVAARSGIELHTEVRIVGERARTGGYRWSAA